MHSHSPARIQALVAALAFATVALVGCSQPAQSPSTVGNSAAPAAAPAANQPATTPSLTGEQTPQQLLDSLANASPKDRITAILGKVAPELKINTVEESQMKGVYQVLTEDIQLFYISADGRYLLNGTMFDVATKTPVSEDIKSGLRTERLKQFDAKDLITFPANKSATGAAPDEVYVFTDISCSFCMRLHEHVNDFAAKNITVHYIPFPRNGAAAGDPTADKMRQIWCSRDRVDAMNIAKSNGQLLAKSDCEGAGAVQRGFDLGRQMGVSGTPAIFTPDGVQVGGYLNADRLRSTLDAVKAQKAARTP